MSDALRNNTGQAINLQGARAVVVVPNDSVDLSLVEGQTGPTLYVGADGNVAVETIGGDTVTFVAVVAGSFMPLQVRKVLATGTTATSILEVR